MNRAIGIAVGMELYDENTGTFYRVTGRNAGGLAYVDIFDEIDEDGNQIKTGEGYLTNGEIANLAGARFAYWPVEGE